MKANNTLLQKALSLYLQDAAERRTNEGLSGGWGDGGAGLMEAQVRAYRDGMEGVVPEFLKGTYRQVERAQDPDYEAYMRLRAKFEDTH